MSVLSQIDELISIISKSNDICMFSFQKSNDENDTEDTQEQYLIKQFCKNNDKYKYEYFEIPPQNTIPVGSVVFCEKVYGKIKPNYYPNFMKDYLFRKVWITNDVSKYDNIFCKPANSYKKWNGSIKSNDSTHSSVNECKEEVWCSEIVHFVNEWRYYIVNGDVIGSAWYDGDISDKDVLKGLAKKPPILPTDLLNKLKQNNYFGVMDLGEIIINSKTVLSLVEACHPYAVGWYLQTNDYTKYANFVIESDKYMRAITK
eukprot:347071_1